MAETNNEESKVEEILDEIEDIAKKAADKLDKLANGENDKEEE